MASTDNLASGGPGQQTGQASRVAVGYIRAHLLMTEHELADAKRDLTACAAQAGYLLGMIYVEQPDQVPSAFEALVTDLVNRASDHGAAVVLVPGVHHLAGLGVSPDLLKTHLENATGARVLIARHWP